MVDDAGRIDDSQLRSAVERLEATSRVAREEQGVANSRIDAIREEEIAANVRSDAIREEQVAATARLNAIEKEQAATNARLDVIGNEQSAMNARLDTLILRIDRLFYAIISGMIAVSASVLIHGFIGG